MPKKILIIGKSGREHALLDAFYRSPQKKQIHFFSEYLTPSIRNKCSGYLIHDLKDLDFIIEYAGFVTPDFAFIGSEDLLGAGIVDMLASKGIPAIGPTKELAQLETSKSYSRNLINEYDISGNPRYKVFRELRGILTYMRELGSFVIKPDGLTGGKGVQIFGEHLDSFDTSLRYCQEVLATHGSVVIEEKFDGEEFSLHSFCDGRNIIHMPPVQDHKRVFNDDQGPNTGGMGSYLCEDHLLPFLTQEELRVAQKINEEVYRAVMTKTGKPYKGILYGSYILTGDGVKIIEYNVRFGDPESINLLSILDTDLIDISEAIISGKLNEITIRFKNQASVCKYLVPEGYPDDPMTEKLIYLNDFVESDDLKIMYSSINVDEGWLTEHGSRTLAIVGNGDSLDVVERNVEAAICKINGPVFHRSDIGTKKLIQKRIDHIKTIRECQPVN